MRNKTLIFTWMIYITAIAILIAADLLTKMWIYDPIEANGQSIVIIPKILRFVAEPNEGASFGMFKDKTVFLTYMSLFVSIILTAVLFAAINQRKPIFSFSLIMIIGGGLGNCIDRFSLGYVRDFIYVEAIDYYVFNLADSFLFIGTVLLIIFVIFCTKTSESVPKK